MRNRPNINKLLTALLITMCALPHIAVGSVIDTIYDLNIGGTKYDVTLHNQPHSSFNNLWDANDDGVFGGSTSVFSIQPLYWGDMAGAILARDTIISFLGTNIGTSHSTITDGFAIPFSTSIFGTTLHQGFDNIVYQSDFDFSLAVENPTFAHIFDAVDLSSSTPYASFAPSHVVPIPSALYLFSLGLLGLVNIARK